MILLLAACTTTGPCEPGLELDQCPEDLVLPDRTDHPVAVSDVHRDVVLIELSALW